MATIGEKLTTIHNSITSSIETVSTKVSGLVSKSGDVMTGNLLPSKTKELNLGSSTSEWNGYFNNIEVTGTAKGISGLPVGFPAHWLGTTPPPGWLDMSKDQGLLLRSAYPELWIAARDSGNILTDTDWNTAKTTNGAVGSFSSGDGSTTFRIPFEHGVYRRSADSTGGLIVGQYQKDAQQNITGTLAAIADTRIDVVVTEATGVFSTTKGSTAQYVNRAVATASGTTAIKLDTAEQVRTADEVRPVTVVYLPIIKAFDVVINAANIEVGGLVTQLGMTNDRIAVSQQVMHIRDKKAYNEHGGTFTSGSWYTRDLNDTVINTIPGASLTNNQFTLPAGRYFLDAKAPAYMVDVHRICLYNITDSAYFIFSRDVAPAWVNYALGSDAEIQIDFTISAEKTYEIRHVCQTTRATNGFGYSFGANIPTSTSPSIYTDVHIRRIS